MGLNTGVCFQKECDKSRMSKHREFATAYAVWGFALTLLFIRTIINTILLKGAGTMKYFVVAFANMVCLAPFAPAR